MNNLPICQLHNRPIGFVDINKDVAKSQRALCNLCKLNSPIAIEIALQEKKDYIEGEFSKYNDYFLQFLLPIEKKIKQLGVIKNQIENSIALIENKLTYQREQLIQKKEIVLRNFLINFECLSISDIQNIGEELSQKNDQDNFQEIKKQYDEKVEQILNLNEVKILDQIKKLSDQIYSIFQQEEFEKDFQKGLLKFQPFDQKEFKLDCYATCINNNETYIVASHNIELILYEINDNKITRLDKIHDIGFFYEIVFDQNDNNLLYLADYNSSLRIMKIGNKKFQILDTVVKFKQPVSCLVCTQKSEVIVSSQDLSFQSYKFIDGVFTLLQSIGGVEKEISSISINNDETLMATSHINSKITIWQKQENLWVIHKVIDTMSEQDCSASQLKIRKDRNAVCFLHHNILAYLSDSGIFRIYSYENNTFLVLNQFPQSIDKQNHFPSTFTLRFNKKTGLLVCHQYHKLQIFKQKDDGNLELFQKFKDYKRKITGCSLSYRFMLAQDSENNKFHILKLSK